MRLVLHQGADRGKLDLVGSLEIGLAAVQRMNLQPLGAHRHHLVANLHDIGEADFVQPLGQSYPAQLGRSHSVSFPLKGDLSLADEV